MYLSASFKYIFCAVVQFNTTVSACTNYNVQKTGGWKYSRKKKKNKTHDLPHLETLGYVEQYKPHVVDNLKQTGMTGFVSFFA